MAARECKSLSTSHQEQSSTPSTPRPVRPVTRSGGEGLASSRMVMSWSFSSIHLPTVGCLVFFLPPHSLCAPSFNASGGADIHQRHRARFVCAGPCDGRGDSDKGAGDTCGHHPAGHCHRLAPNMRCRCGSKRRGDWRAVHVTASNTRGAFASVCLCMCVSLYVSVCGTPMARAQVQCTPSL